MTGRRKCKEKYFLRLAEAVSIVLPLPLLFIDLGMVVDQTKEGHSFSLAATLFQLLRQ